MTKARTVAHPVDDRHDAIEHLRRLAGYVESTTRLERRADCCGNAAVAALLRERAGERRRMAEQVRSHLDLRALPPRGLSRLAG